MLIPAIHGFVGTNLVQALKATHAIFGLDIVNPVSYSECDSKSRPEYISEAIRVGEESRIASDFEPTSHLIKIKNQRKLNVGL